MVSELEVLNVIPDASATNCFSVTWRSLPDEANRIKWSSKSKYSRDRDVELNRIWYEGQSWSSWTWVWLTGANADEVVTVILQAPNSSTGQTTYAWQTPPTGHPKGMWSNVCKIPTPAHCLSPSASPEWNRVQPFSRSFVPEPKLRVEASAMYPVRHFMYHKQVHGSWELCLHLWRSQLTRHWTPTAYLDPCRLLWAKASWTPWAKAHGSLLTQYWAE